MTDDPIDLDSHRSLSAQKNTEARRHTAEVEADQATLRHDRDELEKVLFAAPATNWRQVGDKVRYLLAIFAATYEGQDGRNNQLIRNVIEDIERLSAPGGG